MIYLGHPTTAKFMKRCLLITLFSVLTLFSFAQEKYIKYQALKINGLAFNSSKSDIIKQFGKPRKVFEPNYECGSLSADWQGRKMYSMLYPAVLFTGNDTDKYQLEHIYFGYKNGIKVTYEGMTLSAGTSIRTFEAIVKTKVVNNEIQLWFAGSDDALIFTFKKGLLYKLEYWSPC
jgi:hypothetical protein